MLIKSRALPTEIKFLVMGKWSGSATFYLYYDSAYLQMTLRPNCTKLLVSPSFPSPLLQGGSTGIAEMTSRLNAV